jgi:hypothetical protein
MKHLIKLSLLLILFSCNNTSTNLFKFNKKELNNDVEIEILTNKKFTYQKFNFDMEVPSHWDIQEFNDTLNHSFTLQATSWDSTDLSWSYQIQAINWKAQDKLDQLFKKEQAKAISKYQSKIIDKGEYISNKVKHLWMLIERFDESIGLNQRQLLFYSKANTSDFYLVSINITGSEAPQENILKHIHYIDKFRLLK